MPVTRHIFCVLDAVLEAVITILLNSAGKGNSNPVPASARSLFSPSTGVRESPWEQGCFNHYLGGIVLRMCDVLVSSR